MVLQELIQLKLKKKVNNLKHWKWIVYRKKIKYKIKKNELDDIQQITRLKS